MSWLWSLLAFLFLVAIVFIVAAAVFHLLDPIKGLRTIWTNIVVGVLLPLLLDQVGQLGPYVEELHSVDFTDMLDAKRARWLTVGIALANVYFRKRTDTAVGRPGLLP